MFLGHVMVPRFVMHDDIPKLCDRVRLVVESSFHDIRVHLFGTGVCFFLDQEKHYIDLDRATNVLMHILSIYFMIFLHGYVFQLLQVFFNLLLDLIPVFGLSE